MTLRERLAASVTDIRTRGQRLVQLNLELLTAELREKGRKFGAAIALFVGAGLLALYAIGFALATIATALALFLPWWLSLLIVTLVLFLVVAILALVGRDQMRKIGKPQPELAIAEARATADLMKTNARETAARVRARATPSRASRGPDVRPPRVVHPASTSAPPAGGSLSGGQPPGGPPPASGPPPSEPSPSGPDAPASGPSSDTGARES
jgi:membrane protein implicated in regulation of membrane protease activity